MISNDLKRTQKIELLKLVSKADSAVNHITKKKSKLKGGSVQEIDEFNDNDLDEALQSDNLWECPNALCLV